MVLGSLWGYQRRHESVQGCQHLLGQLMEVMSEGVISKLTIKLSGCYQLFQALQQYPIFRYMALPLADKTLGRLRKACSRTGVIRPKNRRRLS
jgi:hypothetical protein